MVLCDHPEGRPLAQRYWAWALILWREEFARDFPVYRSVRNPISQAAWAVLDRSAPSKRLELGEAIIGGEMDKLGVSPQISAEAKTLIERFEMQAGLYGMGSVIRYPHVTLPPPLRNQLRKEIFKVLDRILGANRHRQEGSLWVYTTPIGRWKLQTRICLRPGSFKYPSHLACEHALFFAEQKVAHALQALPPILSDVCWSMTADHEIPSVVLSLSVVLARFLDVAPQLLV